MQITGTNIIAAPGHAVWSALNDPDVLRRCLPGCDSVERTGAEDFKIIMTASVGPLKARFNGKLRMTDVKAPTDCVLHFEGQGGAMGFGKGTSTVSLREVAEGTELTYTAEAQVGGKLAQVGSRLIDSVARKMSDDFFKAFRNQVAAQDAPAAAQERQATNDVREALRPHGAAQADPAAPTLLAPQAVGAPAAATASDAAVRSEPATFMVPAWWLGPAVLIGAIVAIAGGLLLG